MSDIRLPESVGLRPGPGGSPVLRVDGPGGWAEIHLHGAHVTAWAPAGEPSVLWLSPLSRYGEAAAIRGGVPLCFPWFGPLAGHPDAPRHGIGRTALWSLDEAREIDGDVVVRLVLRDDETTHASAWPHPFVALCTVTVGARLTVTLTFTHLGPVPVLLEEALHTYLAVGDVASAEVLGLEGVGYVDKAAGGVRVPGADGPVRIAGEVDRIYLDTAAPVTVRDLGRGDRGDRAVTVAKTGSATTVVWNPWAAVARATADVDDDGWRRFLCVEASNVGAAAVPLAPGATHEVSTTITVSGVGSVLAGTPTGTA